MGAHCFNIWWKFVRKTFLKKVEVLKWSEICGNIEAGIKVF
jgi:hypothetical protein